MVQAVRHPARLRHWEVLAGRLGPQHRPAAALRRVLRALRHGLVQTGEPAFVDDHCRRRADVHLHFGHAAPVHHRLPARTGQLSQRPVAAECGSDRGAVHELSWVRRRSRRLVLAGPVLGGAGLGLVRLLVARVRHVRQPVLDVAHRSVVLLGAAAAAVDGPRQVASQDGFPAVRGRGGEVHHHHHHRVPLDGLRVGHVRGPDHARRLVVPHRGHHVAVRAAGLQGRLVPPVGGGGPYVRLHVGVLLGDHDADKRRVRRHHAPEPDGVLHLGHLHVRRGVHVGVHRG
mmetsp:Transcript_22489/g.67399  ORF Transcript_22489/g.67399 Transcript_22489/m.67399 type:complete len:287 (+) Transcript_22489:452-1312(+)